MKKLPLLFILGLTLFATSCLSDTDEIFLNKVIDKTATVANSNNNYIDIEFTYYGGRFDYEDCTYEFVISSSEDEAKYSGVYYGLVYEFIITLDENSIKLQQYLDDKPTDVLLEGSLK